MMFVPIGYGFYGLTEEIKLDENITFKVHVFDAKFGTDLTGAVCTLRIWDNDWNKQIEETMTEQVEANHDFEFNANTSGDFFANMECTKSGRGSSISREFSVKDEILNQTILSTDSNNNFTNTNNLIDNHDISMNNNFTNLSTDINNNFTALNTSIISVNDTILEVGTNLTNANFTIINNSDTNQVNLFNFLNVNFTDVFDRFDTVDATLSTIQATIVSQNPILDEILRIIRFIGLNTFGTI